MSRPLFFLLFAFPPPPLPHPLRRRRRSGRGGRVARRDPALARLLYCLKKKAQKELVKRKAQKVLLSGGPRVSSSSSSIGDREDQGRGCQGPRGGAGLAPDQSRRLQRLSEDACAEILRTGSSKR